MSVQIQILHVGPASRSTRVPWLLEELGADVQKNVDLKQFSLLKPEEYRNDAFRSKYSTNSKFPVLVDDDLTLVEGPAINSYILRKFAPSSPLLPHNAKELAIYDSVNSFLVGHVDELVFNSVVESLMVPEDKRNVEFLTSSHKKFDEAVAFFERRLEKGQYIVSNTFTAADINLSVTLFFANLIGWLNTHPKLQEYLKRAISRPSWSKLKVEEGLKSLQG